MQKDGLLQSQALCAIMAALHRMECRRKGLVGWLLGRPLQAQRAASSQSRSATCSL